jgi:hypothetical protein
LWGSKLGNYLFGEREIKEDIGRPNEIVTLTDYLQELVMIKDTYGYGYIQEEIKMVKEVQNGNHDMAIAIASLRQQEAEIHKWKVAMAKYYAVKWPLIIYWFMGEQSIIVLGYRLLSIFFYQLIDYFQFFLFTITISTPPNCLGQCIVDILAAKNVSIPNNEEP